MDPKRYLIEELCALTGFPRRTIRYYVQNGLIDPPAGRGRGGFYAEEVLQRLLKIRKLQEQGLRMDAVAAALSREEADAGPHVPAAAVPAREPSRGIWTRYEVVPGVEVHVSGEIGEETAEKISEGIGFLKSILKGGGR
jgi:DNA-binding transcriptional MerR regulator